AWLDSNGCVPLYHLMEDAATAEICRSQLWQWIKFGAKLNDGTVITADLFNEIIGEELAKLKNTDNGKLELAADLFTNMVLNEEFDEFLTLPAYNHLN
ncbi:MAG: malate synthase A, partial [Candidatus Marinimicrobia bacterium]|nr:malate synthase A [Candidatus Neomarinimicrobiota bacterium]